LPTYLERFHEVLVAALQDFGVMATTRPGQVGVWAGSRMIASVGVAVRSWVSYYGAALNVSPDLEPFRRIRTGTGEPPMTSLERERRGRVRPALVRERLVELFAARFNFPRTSLFFDHPSLGRKAPTDAIAASP
jgi:lipoyl(octanoyl) transferase